jgi:hypothetical protein
MAVPEPPIFQSASLINGLPTVTFQPRPYPRVVTSIFVQSIVPATATFYRNLITPAAVIDSNTVANPNTYTVPFRLPTGQILYVVFSSATSPVSNAYAKLTAAREG